MNTRRRNRTMTIDSVETLDERVVPSGSGLIGTPLPAPEVVSPVYTPNGSPLDKAGQALNIVYSEYYTYYVDGSPGNFAATGAGNIQVHGTSVGVEIRVNGPINMLSAQLQGIGMRVTAVNATDGVIVGQLPIVDLPTVTSNGYIIGISPIYNPILHAYTTSPTTPTSVLMAKAGSQLTTVYNEYETYALDGSPGTFSSSQASKIEIQGTTVGVVIHVNGPTTLIASQLKGVGMKISTVDPTDGIILGQLPISVLTQVAYNGYITSISPIYRAGNLGNGGGGYQPL